MGNIKTKDNTTITTKTTTTHTTAKTSTSKSNSKPKKKEVTLDVNMQYLNKLILDCENASSKDKTGRTFIKDYPVLHLIEEFDDLTIYIYEILHNEAYLLRNQKRNFNKLKNIHSDALKNDPLSDYPVSYSYDDFSVWFRNSLARTTLSNKINTLIEYGFIKVVKSKEDKRGNAYVILKDMDEVQEFEIKACNEFLQKIELENKTEEELEIKKDFDKTIEKWRDWKDENFNW